jgi:hypothetical protein
MTQYPKHPSLNPLPQGERGKFGHWSIGYYLMIGVWNLVLVHFSFPINAEAIVFFCISFVPS